MSTKQQRSQSAVRDAQERGLVTDEGVNEDRTGARGPTLEEGQRPPHAPRPQAGNRRRRAARPR